MIGQLAKRISFFFSSRSANANSPLRILSAACEAEKHNDYKTAIEWLEEILRLNPDTREAITALGRVLGKSGQLERCVQILQRGSVRWPSDPEIRTLLGNAFLLQGLYRDAIFQFELALKNNAELFPAIVGLGCALREVGEFNRALTLLDRAVKLNPYSAAVFDNLGLVYQSLGNMTESINKFEKALVLDPSLHNARLHLGISHLLRGEFEKGWRGYESRFDASGEIDRTKSFKRWNGVGHKNASLLILSEQGLGDEIMFASCIPDTVDQMGYVYVECNPRLVTLFRRSFAKAEIVPRNSPVLPKVDYAISSASLGGIFRKYVNGFPQHNGYLTADLAKREQWRKRLSHLNNKINVAISWIGGTQSTHRSRRSIRLKDWLPVLQTPNINFISLQYTDCTNEIAEFTGETNIFLHRWQSAIDDLDETAALVAEVDLVISVQSTLVHLGGSLGKAVWVLVPVCPEWRYQASGQTIPWYPSVRIFRQKTMFQWNEVMSTVSSELKAFSEIHHTS